MNKNGKDDILSGVGCDVHSCVYHGTDDMCHASGITVETQSQNCYSETETFCGTFEAQE